MKTIRHGIPRSVTGWAIDSNYTDIDGREYHGFLGLHYFSYEPSLVQGAYNVMGVAVWLNREEARQANASHKAKNYVAHPDARVVKVIVDVGLASS